MPLVASEVNSTVNNDANLPETIEQDYLWTLNFGPQHPATHTTLRLVLTLDGERIVKAVPDIGFLHSGFEKLGEELDFNQYVTIVDRMNYISPLANEIAWHHAVEKLLGLELTPRCKYLRTILAELMRLHDHLLNVGTTGLDLGAFTGFLYAFQQREVINDIVEFASGQRFHTSYTRVGGVLFDVNDL
jgi:NADH-quinone oxidoreductase subunit D